MFFEIRIRIKRLVVLQPHKPRGGILLTASILTQLLEDMKALKCSEDHGYYVAATTLESVGEGKVRSRTGAVVFPVEFNYIVFKPYKREILHGEVAKVLKHGCILSCGPLEEFFLHADSMKGFEYKMGETIEPSSFRSEDGYDIRAGTLLRFQILGLKWVEDQRLFKVLATLDGDYLGPIPEQTDLNF